MERHRKSKLYCEDYAKVPQPLGFLGSRHKFRLPAPPLDVLYFRPRLFGWVDGVALLCRRHGWNSAPARIGVRSGLQISNNVRPRTLRALRIAFSPALLGGSMVLRFFAVDMVGILHLRGLASAPVCRFPTMFDPGLGTFA